VLAVVGRQHDGHPRLQERVPVAARTVIALRCENSNDITVLVVDQDEGRDKYGYQQRWQGDRSKAS
jgi:hypothetical protein